MNLPHIRVGLALLALVACRDDEPPRPPMAEAAKVLPNLPLPPQASLVRRDGSADALKITLRSTAKVEVIEAYYRDVLTRNGWRLVNDARDREGATVLLAERDGPPLWVRIRRTDDGVATLVELAGAIVPEPSS
jgi:hypothetical protein